MWKAATKAPNSQMTASLRIRAGESGNQLLGVTVVTNVFLPDDLGFTVDASALPEVVIEVYRGSAF